jgi:hypothetical protein
VSTSIFRTSSFFLLILGSPLFSQVISAPSFVDPGTSETFDQAIQGLPLLHHYNFGTEHGRNIRDLESLSRFFDPYGIAGTIVINQEWEIYEPFNCANFVFTPDTLNLTATIPPGGGLFPGGIHSGQIWTKDTFQPGTNGKVVYAFEVRMRAPAGPGMWYGAWLYTKTPGTDDHSEIDDPEFLNMQWQNEFDWSSTLHGPGVGAMIYNIRSNPWTWHPGLNFSADFHDYQTIWTEDTVYAYVDGTLISAQSFHWTAKGPPQLGISFAVGSSLPNLPGLQPTSLSQFPATLQVDHLTIWAR